MVVIRGSRGFRASVLSVTTAIGLLLTHTTPASAEPATAVSYPSSASATRFTGLAFDTCTAPTAAQMSAWRASPYRGIGVYVGGENRSCAQPELTASWVTTVARQGWRIVPIYLGLQAPCTYRGRGTKISPSQARTQGTAQAADAAAKVRSLGMSRGTAIYNDMEHYDPNISSCRTAVLTYLSAWTKELHRQGYVSGVYAHLNSGALHLAQAYTSTTYARPDAIWVARWDLNSSLSGWSGIPDSRWATGQRGKQYRGDHHETHGGVTLNIDSDRFDAPVATVALAYSVTSSTSLNARKASTVSAPVVTSYAPRSRLQVICQTAGSKVGTTSVWDKLSNGTFVTDYYVSTPSRTTYSAPIPRCTYPYQTTIDGLNRRSGPGTSYGVLGSLRVGSLAWVSCQRAGTKVGTTSVWDRLVDGSWVTDHYVASPSTTTYSAPVPRC